MHNKIFSYFRKLNPFKPKSDLTSKMLTQAQKKKYYVEKIKVRGPNFIEHRYNPSTEDITGIWVKYGQGYSNDNPAVKMLKCESCLKAEQYYRRKEQILNMRYELQILIQTFPAKTHDQLLKQNYKQTV